MAEGVRKTDPRIRRWIIIILCVLTSLFLLLFGIATAERILLTGLLPGQWELLAGGGQEGYIFCEDGTVSILGRNQTIESEQTWHLEYASIQQNQRFWSHPLLILYIGNRAYGVHIGLEGLMVNHGERVSGIPWSMSLTFEGDGGGGYVKTDGMK